MALMGALAGSLAHFRGFYITIRDVYCPTYSASGQYGGLHSTQLFASIFFSLPGTRSNIQGTVEFNGHVSRCSRLVLRLKVAYSILCNFGNRVENLPRNYFTPTYHVNSRIHEGHCVPGTIRHCYCVCSYPQIDRTHRCALESNEFRLVWNRLAQLPRAH